MLADTFRIAMPMRAYSARCLAIVFTICLLTGAGGVPAARDPEAFADVSMIELIAAPQQYEGRLVRAIGFCWLAFEGNALYFHREDHEQGISKNAVWLDVGWPTPSKYTVRRGQYVIVEGTFTARERGHFGMYAGSIKSVTRLEEWRGFRDIQPPPKPN